MGQLSQFLRKGDGFIAHYCPACREPHAFHVTKPDPITGCQWEWDGNIVDPTFSPSMLLGYLKGNRKIILCHYTLQKGIITFLPDSLHALRGITMHLPALPEMLRDKCLI